LLGLDDIEERETSCNRILPSLFAFFLIINIISSGGHFDWSDGVLTFLVSESMVLKHSAKLHPDIPSISSFYGPTEDEVRSRSPYYTHRPIMLAAVAVPFYYAAIASSLDPIELIGIFVNSLIITLIALVIFCFSFDLFKSRLVAFTLSLVFIGCSFVLPYNTTFFPQPLQGLCLIAGAYFLYISKRRNDLRAYESENAKEGLFIPRQICFAGLAGLFLGLSVFAHPTSVIFIPGFIAYSLFFSKYRIKTVFIVFLIVLGVVLFFVGIINFLKFGSFTEFGYGWMGAWSTLNTGFEGLIGLWVSPGVGLVFFFPIVILLPLALKTFYRSNTGLFFLTVYALMITWVYFGTLWYLGPYWQTITWSGGLAWGPRYLIPLLPFLVIPFGSLIVNLQSHNKKTLLKVLIVSLCVAGFLINLPGSLVWIYNNWDYVFMRQELSNYDEIYNTLTWDPYYSPIFLSAKILLENYASNLKPGEYQSSASFFYITYGLSPCPYDTYIYCKFGAIPTLALGTAAGIIALFILGGRSRLLVLNLKHISLKRDPKRATKNSNRVSSGLK
jgi:hypothetical protein